MNSKTLRDTFSDHTFTQILIEESFQLNFYARISIKILIFEIIEVQFYATISNKFQVQKKNSLKACFHASFIPILAFKNFSKRDFHGEIFPILYGYTTLSISR